MQNVGRQYNDFFKVNTVRQVVVIAFIGLSRGRSSFYQH